MSKVSLLVMALLLTTAVSAQDHDHHQDHQEPAGGEGFDFAEMQHMLSHHHGDQVNFLFLAERLEYQSQDAGNRMLWDVQGWVGKDTRRLWIKSEGNRAAKGGERAAELQVLYSHAIAPFWDVQVGLRHDYSSQSALAGGQGGRNGSANHNYGVLGIQGLAPYWFEVDAALFVDESGDLSTRLETEYQFRLTQRLILQPRAEFEWMDSNSGISSQSGAMGKLEAGFRLRYELRREFAPYLGVEWERERYRSLPQQYTTRGNSFTDTRIVAGFRVWY